MLRKAEKCHDSPFHREAYHIVLNRSYWSYNYLTVVLWVIDFALPSKELKGIS